MKEAVASARSSKLDLLVAASVIVPESVMSRAVWMTDFLLHEPEQHFEIWLLSQGFQTIEQKQQ